MSKQGKKLFEEARRKVLGDKLKFIYSKIPRVKCKGHCHSFCAAIGLESVEVENIKNHHTDFPQGFQIPDGTIRCGALTQNNLCSIYDNRPLICRLFGATDQMLQCPIGCELEDGESRLEWNDVIRLFTELKLFNLGYYFPKKLEFLESMDSKGIPVDLEKYLLDAQFNVPQELWQIDMDSELLKTEKVMKEFTQDENYNMANHVLQRKWLLIQKLREKLDSIKLNDPIKEITVFNSDNMKEYDFEIELLKSKSNEELFQFLFIEGNIEK